MSATPRGPRGYTTGGRDCRAGTIALRADEVMVMLAELRAAAITPAALVVDHDDERRARTMAMLAAQGYAGSAAWTPLDAIHYLVHAPADVAIAIIAEDVVGGFHLRAFMAEHYPEVPVVVLADRLRAGTLLEAGLSGRASGGRRAAPMPFLTEPRALVAPTTPYRPAMAAPWRRGQASVVELPISVTPWLRLPAIGTTLLVTPPWLRRRLVAGAAHHALFNLELHGIDGCDAELDGIPGELVARQPDLRRTVAEKAATLDEILGHLVATRRVHTLAEVASHVQRAA